MTPFRKDCKNIQPANRKIFLADGSAVLCKEMGTIDIPISNSQTKLGIYKLDNVSLQSNVLVVGDSKSKNRSKGLNIKSNKKIRLSTNVLHGRFHRSDRSFATIKAHDLWEDVYIIPRNDSVCPSFKIMTIPATSRGKTRISQLVSPLEEIQVDTVPNPEPLGLSPESRYNYFLIICDRFSRPFRLICVQDKITDQKLLDSLTVAYSHLMRNHYL